MKGPIVTEEERETVLGGGLAGVLAGQSNAIAEGMQGLCVAIGKLAETRDALTEYMKRVPHGDQAEKVALGVSRGCEHLMQAVADLPNELWAHMLASRHVGVAEVRERLEHASARAA